MTMAGGKTTRFTNRVTREVNYEIAIGSSMLFEGFGTVNRRISVCGLACENRLEALQRIFEHLRRTVNQVTAAGRPTETRHRCRSAWSCAEWRVRNDSHIAKMA